MNYEKRKQQMMTAAEAYAEEVSYKDEHDLCSTLNVFCAGWRAADSHPAWIPVEERNPDEGQVVLIYSKGGDVCVTCYKNGAFNCSPLFQAINVTHWMEIVPPQRKEE